MVYLTSHGDKAYHLSSSYAPLELDDVTPMALNCWATPVSAGA